MQTVYQVGKGFLPSELTDALLIEFTGWSWRDLRSAPAWLVRDLLLIKNGNAIRAKEANKPPPKR